MEKKELTHNPLYYPSRRETKKIVEELEAHSHEHIVHHASNTNRLQLKLKEEARVFVEKRYAVLCSNHFQIVDVDGEDGN